MGIISGIIESLISEVIKENTPGFYGKNKGCIKAFLLFVGVVTFLFFALLVWVNSSTKDEEQLIWNQVLVGDSLFVKSNSILGIDFYKKGRVKLSEWEQREIKFRREDTLKFNRVNNVPDKFFYKVNTSFIGICLGQDSIKTESRNKWLMIKPSEEIQNPVLSQNGFDRNMRKWENPKENFDSFKLSENFYVELSDIVLLNNDKVFE